LLSNILKNNLISSVLLIVVLGILCVIPALPGNAFQVPAGAQGSIFASLMQYNESRTFLVLFSALLLLGSAFLFNYVLNSSETLSRFSFFTAFVIVLISSEIFASYDLHPGAIANFLIIVGMMRIMKSYREDDAKSVFFDGAFFISAASLFYFPSITLLPLVFIALIILRPFIWREWVMALMGMAAPHIFTAAILYVMGRLDRYYNESMFAGFDIRAFRPALGAQFFVLVCLGFLFILVTFKRLSGGASRKIRQQKNINLLGFWFVFGMGGVFYESPYTTSVPVLCIPPMAGILSEWLGNFKRSTLSDFALLLLITAFTLSVLQIRAYI
jgi:hypothetical protein